VAVATAVVVVLDRSEGLEEEDRSVLEATAGSRRVLALNKMDVA
jgi:translation elongation factor EF-G